MCGIAGIIERTNNVNADELKRMCNRLSLRGPDAEGFYIKKNVGLGHRRLSVIDLETGDQPMFNREKTISIVFNGEIYNFQSLRDELKERGYVFSTNSDTEVIINGYIEYGIDSLLQKIEGMYAFALYDEMNEKTYIVRDKFGEKPLYYSLKDDRLIFASELKAFDDILPQKEISKEGLNYFLSLSYIPAPLTIYKSVFKLAAGSFITIDKQFEVQTRHYYNLLDRIALQTKYENFEYCKKELKELLFDSVKKRMISDVPLGVFLSGGIDSSIVASIMSKISDEQINTFSIGFKEKEYDESNRAQLVAKHVNSNHTIHYLNYNDVVDVVNDLILHFDEPFGDSSAIPSYFVAKLAREKVTVVLTGDCADELFMGYEKYLAPLYISKYRVLPKALKWLIEKGISLIPHIGFTNITLRKIKKVISNSSLSDFDLHYNLMCMGFSDKERSDVLTKDNFTDVQKNLRTIYDSYKTEASPEKGLFLDLKTVLEGDMLVKVDRMCMKNSLEARVPFLDSKIVEAAYRMPLNFKLNGKNKKYILKETFKDLLPTATLKFVKKGFSAPIDYWLKNELNAELKNLLDEKFIEEQGVFNFAEVNRLYVEHMSLKENHMAKLWNLYVFQKWYKRKILSM